MLNRLNRNFILFPFFFLVLWGFPNSAGSQTPKVWTNLGLYGGQIYDIAIDPSTPDKIFAGSYLGDGLFVSQDGGNNWLPVETDNEPEGEGTFKNHAIWAVEIAPGNHQIIWVAHDYWVEKSTDGGQTWIHIKNQNMQKNCSGCTAGDDFRFCQAIAIDPHNPDIVYVGTGGPGGSSSSGAIYKTADGGQTWTKLTNIFDIGLNPIADFYGPILSIEIDANCNPIDGNCNIWAATTGSDNPWEGYLFRSNDEGQTWIDSFYIGTQWLDMALKPHNTGDPSQIYIATAFGIYRQTRAADEDATFLGGSFILGGAWGAENNIRTVVFDPQNPQIVYATWRSPIAWGGDGIDKVGRSTNGGDSWSTYVTNLLFLSLAVHPNNSEIVFGGHLNLGVFKSMDHGQSWTPVNEGLSAVIVKDAVIDPNDSSHILAGTVSGVYEKTGSGLWSRLLENDTWSVLFHPTNSQIFFAGIEGYVCKTTDGGLNWTFTNIPDYYSYNNITKMAIDHSNTDVMFVSVDYFGYGGAVHKSEDGGSSFTKVLDGVNTASANVPMNTVVIDPNNSQHVFAGGGLYYAPGNVGDLWESLDGGNNWTRTSLQNVTVNALLIDPSDSAVMYAGCGYSGGTDIPVYKSTDGGATWIPSHAGIPGEEIIIGDLWGFSSTDIFAAGSDGTIVRYNGSTWSDLDSGTTEDFNDIWGSSVSHLFAVGTNGIILRYNGNTWTAMNNGTTSNLNGIWGSGPSNVFAVGSSGTILQYNGSDWSPMSGGTTENLNDVWGSSATNVFAVGDNGTVLHYNGSSWIAWGAATTEDLQGVWGISATDVYGVGASGTIVHYAGTSWIWTVMNSGTTADLEAVWAGSENDVFAVGDNGIILHYDGSSWSAMVSNTTAFVTSAWGADSANVFTGGDTGNILQYNGTEWFAIRLGGSQWNAATDLEFHRLNTNIVYAGTTRAGVYISPNQAGQWLNLGTPVYNVYAVSAGSLFAATEGGLLQCTGTGVIAGKVVQAGSQRGINRARIFTDSGVRTISVNGEYMMVCPSGIHTVAVVADGQANQTLENILVLGADVTWVDVAMQSGVSDPSLDFDANNNSSSGGGGYCFIGSAAF